MPHGSKATRKNTLRIAYIHDNQDTPDGVATVIKNDISGFLRLLKPTGIKPHFHLIGAAGHIDQNRFLGLDRNYLTITAVDHIRAKNGEVAEEDISLKAQEACSQILDMVADDDIVIYENPLIGHWAVALEVFDLLKKEFPIRYPDKDFACRVHDLAEERPDTVMPFLNARYGTDSPRLWKLLYPDEVPLITMNRRYLTIMRMRNPRVNITFIPNSVLPVTGVSDANNADVLRILDLGVLNDGRSARVITYPVRSMPRKCIEEAVLVIEAMNRFFSGVGPFQLALPLTGSPVQKSYQLQVAELIELTHSRYVRYLPFELNAEGEYDSAGAMVTPGLYDLINASFACITTAMQEGFGYAFVEPFVVGQGKAIFGRRLDVTREEFEKNGIDYQGYLYDRLTFNGRDIAEIDSLEDKFRLIVHILGAESLIQKFIQENQDYFFNLARMFIIDTAYIARNRQIIDREYSPQKIVYKLMTEVGFKYHLDSVVEKVT